MRWVDGFQASWADCFRDKPRQPVWFMGSNDSGTFPGPEKHARTASKFNGRQAQKQARQLAWCGSARPQG